MRGDKWIIMWKDMTGCDEGKWTLMQVYVERKEIWVACVMKKWILLWRWEAERNMLWIDCLCWREGSVDWYFSAHNNEKVMLNFLLRQELFKNKNAKHWDGSHFKILGAIEQRKKT